MIDENFEFISMETFKSIVGRSVNKEDLANIYSSQISFADSLLQMCNVYEKMMLNKNDNVKRNAYRLGANIIFNLRKFLLEEDIILSIGATTVENEELKIYEGNITDILKDKSKYSVGLGEKGGLSVLNKLQNLQLKEDNNEAQRNAIWKRILDAKSLTGPYKDFEAIESNSIGEHMMSKGESFIKLYKRNLRLPDSNVLYGYRNKEILTYYQADSIRFLNEGYMFEHFMRKWELADDEQRKYIEMRSLGDHPVSIAADKWDTIAGYKGGDYRDLAGRQMQAKYNKQEFIKTTTITNVMQEIKQLLETRKNDYLNLGNDLVRLFTDEKNMDFRGSLDKINNAYNRKIWKEVALKDIPKKLECSIIVN